MNKDWDTNWSSASSPLLDKNYLSPPPLYKFLKLLIILGALACVSMAGKFFKKLIFFFF